jgi:hypothetical protein
MGLASAIARDRLERAAVPRPKVSLPVLKFMTRPMPAWDEPLPPRRGRS